MGLLAGLLNPKSASQSDLTRLGFTTRLDNGFAVYAPSKSGQMVSTDGALAHSVVYACIKVLSEDIAKLPLFVYRRLEDGGREKVINDGLHRLLHDEPNDWQTSFEFREMMMGHVLLRGNAYAEIIPGFRGDGETVSGIEALIPRHPDRIRVFATPDNGITRYIYTPTAGEAREINPNRMFHLKGISSDGFVGISPIAAARESIGLSMAAETHGSRTFQNAAQVPIAIKHPGELKRETFERLKADFQANLSGAENAGKVLFLEEGMSVEKIGMTNEDSQFLETREFQINEIARFYRIPPHMIQDLKRATFSNIEHQSIDYVVATLQPWCQRWQQTIKRSLIKQKNTFFAEFALQSLMQGDMATRSTFYNSAINTGWMSRNEVRDFENLNRVDGLDAYLQPLNMTEVGADDTDEQNGTAPNAPEDVGASSGDDVSLPDGVPSTRAATIIQIVGACAEKLLHQEIAQITRYAPRYASQSKQWERWLSNFYDRHAKRIQSALFIDDTCTKRYCTLQKEEVLTNGAHIVETWGDSQIRELQTLALSGKNNG